MQIQVKPISASLTRNNQLIGSMDPYVIIIYSGQSHRSKTQNEAGRQPKWDDTFYFSNIQNVNENMRVQVWNENYFKDGMVGEGEIDIGAVLNNPLGNGFNHNVMLSYQGQMAGIVNISITVTKNHNQNKTATAPAQIPVGFSNALTQILASNQNQNYNQQNERGMPIGFQIGKALYQDMNSCNNHW